MEIKEYKKLAKEKGIMTGTRTYDACKLVMVEGLSATQAAIKTGLHTSSVTRPLARLTAELPRCPTCNKLT